MNTLTHFFAQPWAERLGWTLLHFLWQGAAITALFAAARPLAAGKPRTRHAMACLALGSMTAVPLITWFVIGGKAASGPATQSVRLAALPAAIWNGAAGDISSHILMPWLVMLWLTGITAFSVRLAGGWLSTARLRSEGTRPAPAQWNRTLDRLAQRMGIGPGVRLLVSSRVDVPAVLGWLRPVVLMPIGALCGLPAEQVQALLSHELAHIRRNDYVINLLQGVAEALLFYHPAIWWVSKQIRVERELCCDDLAVEASGDVLTYACALAGLESCRPSQVTTAMAADGPPLAERIRRLLEPSQPAHTIPGTGAAWVLAALLLAGLGTVAIGGAGEPQARPATPAVPAATGQHPTVDRNEIWVDTVRQGDMVREVRALGVITSSSTVELRVPEVQSKELKPGQRVSILARGGKDATMGRVVRVRPIAQGENTIDVQIEGALPTSARTGGQVDGTIRLETIQNVVFVGRPVKGLANSEGTLFRIEAGGTQAVRVRVKFGRASVNALEIVSGLSPGDKVILSDTTAFIDSDRINLK
ncbi:MAG TPA: M56 family metallopeptidase [Acidobacteriota bacterium]|nr:M56 family metallopeptidase [Acidobacteriota bacterium]